MKLTRIVATLTVAATLSALGAARAGAASLQYNFTFELTNATSGADFLGDGSFFADPTAANTSYGPNAAGETWATPVNTLALSVFDLGSSPTAGTAVTYSRSDLQNSGLVYFRSYNPADGSADPIFTLSAADPLSGGYLTVVLGGTFTRVYQSSTLGNTSGTPLATGPGVVAIALDTIPSVPTPEPGTVGLMLAAAALSGFAIRRNRAL